MILSLHLEDRDSVIESDLPALSLLIDCRVIDVSAALLERLYLFPAEIDSTRLTSVLLTNPVTQFKDASGNHFDR
jgi:hypothetical protein